MDPFVIVSFGKNVVRTGVQRHNLNPIFNEKFLFPIMRHEQSYTFTLTVIDRDALSNNDFVARAQFPLQEILKRAQKPDSESGIFDFQPIKQEELQPPTRLQKTRERRPSKSRSEKYVLERDAETATAETDETLHTFDIPLTMKNKIKWEDKHNPVIQIRAKYAPYAALRQRFWYYLIRQFDYDDSGLISRIELANLLEHIGSTLHNDTVDSFFSRYGKTIDEDLEIYQVVACLEEQVVKESKEETWQKLDSSNVSVIPIVVQADENTSTTILGTAEDMAAPNATLTESAVAELESGIQELSVDEVSKPEPSDAEYSVKESERTPSQSVESFEEDIPVNESPVERVIKIKECPLCHQPRLDRRTEIDIVTHLATCASQGWRQVDMLTMSAYVTADQAKRKWVGKVV